MAPESLSAGEYSEKVSRRELHRGTEERRECCYLCLKCVWLTLPLCFLCRFFADWCVELWRIVVRDFEQWCHSLSQYQRCGMSHTVFLLVVERQGGKRGDRTEQGEIMSLMFCVCWLVSKQLQVQVGVGVAQGKLKLTAPPDSCPILAQLMNSCLKCVILLCVWHWVSSPDLFLFFFICRMNPDERPTFATILAQFPTN